MASFSVFLSCCIAFIAFSSSVFGFSPSEYSVTCKSYSWWVLFPLNASIVDAWVPDEFPFIPKSSLASEYSSAYSDLPSNKRMVTLEFNKQTDCYTQALKFIKTTFTEFKVQVPFLNAANFNNAAPLMYKPVIYADNLINVAGAIAQYGLNTVYASPMKYDVNNNFYSVDYWHRFIKGKFTPKSDWMPWSSVSQSSFAYQYYPMHQNTEWIGRVDGDKTKCAKHYYLWNDTKIRFVNADITFDKNLVLGNNPAFPINVNGDDLQKLATAFQIETTHHISGLEDCSTR